MNNKALNTIWMAVAATVLSFQAAASILTEHALLALAICLSTWLPVSAVIMREKKKNRNREWKEAKKKSRN